MNRPKGLVRKHGVTSYKRNICRCKICRQANTDYEGRKRNQRQPQNERPRLPIIHDTLTREEWFKYRDADKP